MPAGSISATLERHWAMLSLLRVDTPRTTPEIAQRLRHQSFVFTDRQLQGDLLAYTSANSPVPIERIARKGQPHAWKLKSNARFQPLPAIDLHAAVTLALAERLLEPVLPRETLAELASYFEMARARLDAQTTVRGRRFASWPSKIAAVRELPPLLEASVSPAVLDVVYAALLEEKCLRVEYRTRYGARTRSYDLNPIALAYVGSLGYLVCTDVNAAPSAQDDTKTYLLHRMQSAAVIAGQRRVPPGFDLDQFVRAGRPFVQQSAAPIGFKARVTPEAAVSFEARRLAADQRVTPDGDRVLLEATVWDSFALRVWILGFAEGLEVLEPANVRAEIADKLRRAAAQYGGPQGQQ